MKEFLKGSKYLGNPLTVGAVKVKAFDALRTRMDFRIQSWKAKLLSKAMRAILTESVLYAILTSSMASNKIPL